MFIVVKFIYLSSLLKDNIVSIVRNHEHNNLHMNLKSNVVECNMIKLEFQGAIRSKF